MISLVKFELYKARKSRYMVSLLGALILIYLLFLMLRVTAEQQKVSVDVYKDVYSEIQCLNTEDIREYLENKKQQYAPEELGYIGEKYIQYDEVISNVEQVLSYDVFLQNIYDAGNKYGSVSLFANKKAYNRKNLQVTASAYKDLVDLELPIEGSKGVLGVLVNGTMLVFLLISVYHIITINAIV